MERVPRIAEFRDVFFSGGSERLIAHGRILRDSEGNRRIDFSFIEAEDPLAVVIWRATGEAFAVDVHGKVAYSYTVPPDIGHADQASGAAGQTLGFPTVTTHGAAGVNYPFLAILLRLADILDFDSDDRREARPVSILFPPSLDCGTFSSWRLCALARHYQEAPMTGNALGSADRRCCFHIHATPAPGLHGCL